MIENRTSDDDTHWTTRPSTDRLGMMTRRRKVGKIMTGTFRTACAFLTVIILVGMAAVEHASGAEPIIIGTASPGGPYLTYGQGLARILSRELGQEVTAQSTQGPAQNIVLL